MATFTSQQMNALVQAISDSGLSSKQIAKKNLKVQKLLRKKGPNFEKIITLFDSEKKPRNIQRPKNNWQLFLSDFRENLKNKSNEDPQAPKISGADQTQLASDAWKKMTDEEKKPFNDRALELSNDYKIRIAEIRENNPLSNSSDDDSEKNEIDSDDSHEEKIGKSKPKKVGKSPKQIDLDFLDDDETLDFVRYSKGELSWECSSKENHLIIRESKDSKSFKIFTNEMKSERAVQKSIANRIEKKEQDNFELSGEVTLRKSDLM